MEREIAPKDTGRASAMRLSPPGRSRLATPSTRRLCSTLETPRGSVVADLAPDLPTDRDTPSG